MRNFYKNKSGISLIEVVVSTAIFVVILLAMSGIFKMVIDAQRQAIASQNVQESLKYFFEVISKEIRMAKKDGGGCPDIPVNTRFAISSNSFGDILYLHNYHDECISYRLEQDGEVVRFMRVRNGDNAWLSPARVNISELKFFVHEVNNEQAFVSINLDANYIGKAAAQSEMRVQTSISSRYYRP